MRARVGAALIAVGSLGVLVALLVGVHRLNAQYVPADQAYRRVDGTLNGVRILTGAGVPAVACSPTAPSIYLRTNGGATTTLYVCTGTDTWTAK